MLATCASCRGGLASTRPRTRAGVAPTWEQLYDGSCCTPANTCPPCRLPFPLSTPLFPHAGIHRYRAIRERFAYRLRGDRRRGLARLPTGDDPTAAARLAHAAVSWRRILPPARGGLAPGSVSRPRSQSVDYRRPRSSITGACRGAGNSSWENSWNSPWRAPSTWRSYGRTARATTVFVQPHQYFAAALIRCPARPRRSAARDLVSDASA